jgi:ATP-dependent DNA helicase RecQ
MMSTFAGSSKLDLCVNLINDFEATNPKQKYTSDLDVFIRESRLEDFLPDNGKAILVSTMHKAKGKEFDNVFMMPTHRGALSDEQRRLWYVAMTRARGRLHIYFHGPALDGLHADGLERQDLRGGYPPPPSLVMHLTHEDVNLGYFKYVQKSMNSLMCGDNLTIGEDGWADGHGKTVLKFSRRCNERLLAIEKSGYALQSVKVGFILYWKGQDEKQDVRIILPELYFTRNSSGGKPNAFFFPSPINSQLIN